MADHTDLRGARILLVDDMPANLDLLYALLEPEGYKLSMAPNGEVALRIATETEAVPDLILLDVMMPVMDGYEATRQIRDSQSKVKDRAIPIVAMTANAMQGDRDRCIEVGMADYLSKPVEVPELQQALEKWLGSVPGAAPSHESPTDCDDREY